MKSLCCPHIVVLDHEETIGPFRHNTVVSKLSEGSYVQISI